MGETNLTESCTILETVYLDIEEIIAGKLDGLLNRSITENILPSETFTEKLIVDDYGKAQINHAYRTYICSNKNENQWFSLEAPKQLAKLREGWFNIVSKNGLCVSSRLNNSNLQQEKCGDLDTLLWTIEKTTNGRILRSKTGRQMDASGSYVRGYSKQKTPRQVWAVEQVGVGRFVHFRNFVQNKCLDNYGKNKINGLFRMWKCDDKNEHQWYLMQAPKKLQRFPEGWFNIIGKTGLCMAARNNNGNVIQANCGDTDDLLWTTEREGDGIRIVNKTKRQMDAMGARILGYTKQNTPRQKWAIESLGNGRYHFRNYVQNKCVDDYGKNDVNKPFRMLSCDVKDNNQSFAIVQPKKMKLPKGWINIVGHSGLCMSSRLVNGNLQQQKCGDRESLLWKIERAEKGVGYVLRNKSDR